MGRNPFFLFFCHLLFIHSGSCKDNNRSQHHRPKRDLRLSPIHVTSLRSDQLEQIREAREHEQNNNNSDNSNDYLNVDSKNNQKKLNSDEHNNNNSDNSNDYPNENSKNNQKKLNYDEENNSSFISLKKYKIARKPSRYSYLDQDKKIYTVNTEDKEKKYIQKKINTPSNTFIQKAKGRSHGIVTQVNNLDYVCVMNNDDNIISLFRPYNPEIYSFREMKHYAERNELLNKKVLTIHNDEIKRIEDILSRSMKECSNQTSELSVLINHLENPERYEIPESEYGAKKQNYKDKLSILHECMKRNYNKHKEEIKKSHSRIYGTIDHMDCSWTNYCPTGTYYNMIALRRMDVTNYNIRDITSFLKKIKEIYIFGQDIMKEIKGHLHTSLALETAQFILEEINYIINDMEIHLRKINKAIKDIYELSRQDPWSSFHRTVLQNSLFSLALRYSTFKVSVDVLNKLENASNIKIEKLHQTFRKFKDGLNNTISTHISSTYVISTINYILSSPDEISKSLESLHTFSSEEIKEHILYSNPEIKEAKKNLDEKFAKLNEYFKNTRELAKRINGKFVLNLKTREQLENKRNIKNKENMTPLENCKMLLSVIKDIKLDEKKLKENNKEIEQFSNRIKGIKSNFEETSIGVHEDVRIIKELIEMEKGRHYIKEDIKKHLKYFSMVLDNIKEIISYKDKIEKYIQSMDTLIKEYPDIEQKFTIEKIDLQNKTESIINSFYKENLQTFVDELAESNRKFQALEKDQHTAKGIRELYEQTKKKHEELVNRKCDHIPQILNDLNEVINSLLQLKDKIIKEHTQKIKNDMLSVFNNLTEENKQLKKNLENYKQNAEKMNTYYINTIKERKNKFFTTLIEKEENIPEGKDIYEEYIQHKNDVVNKESTLITHDIGVFRVNITKAKDQIESYKNAMQKLDTENNGTFQEIETWLESLNTKIEQLHLEDLEQELRHYKESVNNAIDEIENMKKEIDTLKFLNILINNSNKNAKSILKIKENKNNLIKKIDIHNEELSNYRIIEEKEKSSLVDMLKELKSSVEKEIPEASIEELEAQEKDLKNSCENEKRHMNGIAVDSTDMDSTDTHRTNVNDSPVDRRLGTNKEKLEKYKTLCQNTELVINKFNANYQALEKKIDALVKNQHSQIITLIDKLIEKKRTEIKEKIELNLNSLNNTKTKINAFHFDEAVRKDRNVTVQSKISAFETHVKDTVQNIDNEIKKMNTMKEKCDSYMEMFHKEKEEQSTEFKDRSKRMEEIYKNMEEIYKNMEEIYNKMQEGSNILNQGTEESSVNLLDKETEESLRNILNHVKQIEMEHTRIFIHHFFHIIQEENEKAKLIMADIESSKKKIDEIQKGTEDVYQQKNMNNFSYEEYYTKATQSIHQINEFSNKATEDKEQADRCNDINEIEHIKTSINSNLQKVKAEYNSIGEIREQMNSMRDLLLLNNSKAIATEIENSTEHALKFREEAVKEHKKAKELLDQVTAKIDKAKEYKDKMNITLDDEQINDHVKNIETIKREIVNKNKNELESYVDKIKEYKDKCKTQVINSNRGKEKIALLKTDKDNKDNNSNNVDMNKVDENIRKSEQYFKEVENLEKEAKNYVQLFMKHEQMINNTFEEAEILGIETKSQKKFNKGKEIIDEIKKRYSEMQEKVTDLQGKLNKLKKKPNIDNNNHDNDDDDDVVIVEEDKVLKEELYNNEMATKAKVLIQTNLESVKYNLSQIVHIKEKGDTVYQKAIDTMNSLTEPLQNKNTKTLDMVKIDESKYMEYVTQINECKNVIIAEMNKLNEISSNVISIEKELNASRRNYEIGLLQRMDEVSQSKKANMDLKKESINSTMNYFSSLSHGLELKEYDFNKNIHVHQQKMKEIYDKFEESLKKIHENLNKALLEENAHYTFANQLRKESQQEKAKLIHSEKEAIKYIEDMKITESMRFIHHIKENLKKISTSINEEKLRIYKGHEFIKQIVEGIKNTDEERDISEKIQQAEEKNAQLQTHMHSTYKNTAKEMLEYITTSARFINIKIIPELTSIELHGNETVKLTFQSDNKDILEIENISKNENELHVQKSIEEAFHLALDINKCANDIEAQQRLNKQFISTINEVHHKTKSIDELKNNVKIAKSKESTISNKLMDISNKIAELDQLSCEEKSYDKRFIENIEKINVKKIRDSFKEEKGKANMDFQLNNIIKKDFVTLQTSLRSVEQAVEALKAKEIHTTYLHATKGDMERVHNKMNNIEQNIATLNESLDKLISKGKECEIANYTSFKSSVQSKINADEEIIHNMQKDVNQYLTFIKNNYNTIMKDIVTLNEHFSNKVIPDYDSTNFEKANKISEELFATVEQSKSIMNNIKNAFIVVKEGTELFTTLNNSAQEIEKLYNTLDNKKNEMNEIYKTSIFIKSQEMKSSASKYTDIGKIFNKVLETQKSEIQNNKSSVDLLKDIINIKLKNLEDTDSTFTLVSINKFDELSNNIKASIEELKQLEQTNRQKHNHVEEDKEHIAHLIKRKESLKNSLKEYEEEENFKKLKGNIPNQVIKDIENMKEEIRKSDELYIELMKKVNENNELCKNNYTENYVSQVLEKIGELKKRFSQNLPEKEKFLQIQGKFNEIKLLFGEIETSYNVEEFVTKMYKQMNNEKESLGDEENREKITLAIQNVTNYKDDVKTYLSKFTNALERINIIKKGIDDLFSSLRNNNTKAKENAKQYVNDSVKIVNELNSHISKITELKNYAENMINKLEEVLSKLIHSPAKDATYETQMLADETEHTHHDHSYSGDHSKGKGAHGRTRFAGSIIIGLSVISGVVLLNRNHNSDEEEEHCEHDDHEAFEGNKDYIVHDKEEVIEVCFSDND
ncbi:normocyte binding protein [Plasmodium knowlesi strain H]|uniref:Normocyte binding protein n=3 Tax=Plasmodium knowlesi TaxID=5850 RepID=A0A5E7WWT9_PLAKH|nr:normocyte binding protein [Plasmodium knowlesi strain H]OTN67427.1 Normocyte binding protein [Plasmodium knowlesi]CAA9987292.1 normocyte binding protein [Plasmodium knowlesi strain H]SBO23434.1 normocyte binding protein [Plasmodium knowlesi strain H]SBO24743.1 normocyte binding protein [Plasmodium knowlesi strain H]VVS76766.1 normocyte binding protein [Plasmodium knowlesi strain H]